MNQRRVNYMAELSRVLVATPQYIETLSTVEDLEDAWNYIQTVLDMPESTIEDLRGIELMDNYFPFSHRINGIPCRGRVISGRDGVDVVIDVRYDTTRLREIQSWIEQRLGRFVLTRRIAHRLSQE